MTDLNQTTLEWRKSTWSNSGDCVEVAFASGSVFVRDSKDPNGLVLSFTSSEWAAFLAGASGDEFDIEGRP